MPPLQGSLAKNTPTPRAPPRSALGWVYAAPPGLIAVLHTTDVGREAKLCSPRRAPAASVACLLQPDFTGRMRRAYHRARQAAAPS